ncbi:hypothetical protein OEA41_007098 [Lepraria neglecta]|uniref:Glycosyltransferase 2-like domain-containing protein n=1 Tax=Lepraria neglecta TaxID=209136 RepID=A0AAD9ZA02_9LECA|nr:hypothetical protein OEA41_007098 [Lepraria neglecta]
MSLALYLGYRVKYIVASHLQTEVPNLFNHFLRCFLIGGPKQAQRLRLLDEKDPPRVDLFITCAGEDIETIVNTAEAACALDYPAHCFRVIVLDDAGLKGLSQKIAKSKESRRNVYYTARKKPLDHHFKAGNLNHGYKYVESLCGGPAPFMAALDADMIPDPKWLRALTPYLLKDENLALAQPPQVRNSNYPLHLVTS